ncbi:MAG: UvrB/UvrC motif-containing protein [bacterium]|nr:UvrB/UvrC motif-containing protein [bacterium]
MERSKLAIYDLPDCPGVYLFKQGRKVIYIGKATSLRDRVRSYFDDDLIATRGPRVVDMVTKATSLSHETTPTVLEALVREAALIRKYHPYANSEGKDDKTFLYAVITDEEIPRVLVFRGKDINFKNKKLLTVNCKLKSIFGPFPSGNQLREGLRLIRKIFPFFDTPKPVGHKSKHQQARVEFNTQIGQYPRDIDFTLSRPIGDTKVKLKKYRQSIRHVAMFLAGKTKELRRVLEKEMKRAAKEERFEDAGEARRQLFALDHIQDVSLIRDESRYPQDDAIAQSRGHRIEAYDTAHISGTNAIGVMAVLIDGVPVKKEYRSFRIRGFHHEGFTKPISGENYGHRQSIDKKLNDDIASLKEILSRRLNHPEWQLPKVIVVDGGRTHKKAAEEVLAQAGPHTNLIGVGAGVSISVAAVVKDEKHRPREVLGALRAGISESDAVLANSEAHRFSLRLHRLARKRANKL